MTDKRPAWFLDVDGVINAICGVAPPGFSSGHAAPGGDDNHKYKIQWDPQVITRINDLDASGDVEILWLTTWGSGANRSLRRLIGINELKVACEPPRRVSAPYAWSSYPPGKWWKLVAVQQFHKKNPGRPIIWTDDDLVFEREAVEWLREKDVLAIAPLQQETLSSRDLDRIEVFVKGDRAVRKLWLHGRAQDSWPI